MLFSVAVAVAAAAGCCCCFSVRLTFTCSVFHCLSTDLRQFIYYVCTADGNQERVEEERQQTEEKTKKVGPNSTSAAMKIKDKLVYQLN